MKIKKECKNEVARKRGYSSFRHLVFIAPNQIIVDDSIDEAMELYAEQFKPKWISVEEKEPKCYERIIFLDTSLKFPDNSFTGIMDIDGRFWADGLMNQKFGVTYWMPLPIKQ